MAVRVLLIEDSPFDRELTDRALARLPVPPGPVELVCAGDWAEAKPRLTAESFDLLLLDFCLPKLNGLQILTELEGLSHPPIIMTTGQDDLATAVETLRAGAYDYVPKSRDWGSPLCLAVQRVLERVQLERELAASRAQLAAYAADLERKVAARTAMVHAQAAEIEALYLKTEEAARIKGEFVSNVSHELRTPLNVIIGYTSLLQDELPQEGTVAQEMLRKVHAGAQRLHSLIESLLELGQLKAGRVGVALSRFTFGDLVEQLRAAAEALNVDKGLRLLWNVPESGREIESDREKIHVVAFHLLSNAIKFTREGQVAVTFASGADGGVVLTVADTGVGFPPDAHAVIFEDFRQLDGSNTRSYEGLGLGLGIVRRYTMLLGGTIRVESAPGKGTTITVELPASAGQPVDAPACVSAD